MDSLKSILFLSSLPVEQTRGVTSEVIAHNTKSSPEKCVKNSMVGHLL